jgi:hypothetical protein
MTTASSAANDAETLDLRFVTKDVTAEEAAAVTAVLLASVREQHAVPPTPVRNDWAHPRRALRSAVEPGPGRWASPLR